MLRKVVRLAGGGREYIYADGGISRVPPRGFKPLNASAASLARYGYPPRPSGGRALRSWRAMMRHIQFVTPPRYLVTDPQARIDDKTPAVTTLLNDHWSGNMAISKTYTNVYASYDEPNIYSSQCSSTEEVMWAGLGGYNTQTLAQDGTGYHFNSMGAHQAWYELLSSAHQNPPVAVNLYATAGQPFTAMVIRETGGYYMYLYNAYTGKAWNHSGTTISFSPYDGSTAEAISERPVFSDGTPTDLSNFKQFEVIDAEAAANYGSYEAIGALPHDAIQMFSDVDYKIIDYPGSTFNGGASWYNYQARCY